MLLKPTTEFWGKLGPRRCQLTTGVPFAQFQEALRGAACTPKSYLGSAAAEQWASFCAMQAVELLREVTGVEPSEYDRQQAADAAGVKNVAIFLTELSTR